MTPGGWAWLVAREPSIVATVALLAAWLIAEYLARRSTWQQGAPRRPSGAIDRGTYPLIALGVTVSLSADLAFFVTGWTAPLPVAFLGVGIGVSAVGLFVRGWALRTLGRFFTMPITLAPDHTIVRSGPYRWLRHPSYTGGFLTVLGISFTLESWPAVLATLLALTVVYVYRIRIEEAALVSRFGEAYREYSRGTSRLIPKIY